VIVTIAVSNQLIADTIADAIESGVMRNWCHRVKRDPVHPLCVGFVESETGTCHSIGADDWPRALSQMAHKAPKHFADLMAGDGDATTADVLVQLACFEGVKYG